MNTDETKGEYNVPEWGEIPDQIKRAMATVLIYMKKNNLMLYTLRDDGSNRFTRRLSEEELQETQRINADAREHLYTDFPKKFDTGYIYLVGAENGNYKIGRAQKLDERINHFGVKLPIKTWLVHSFVSDQYKQAEKILHGKYANKRTHGEWFLLSADDVQEICAIQDGQL